MVDAEFESAMATLGRVSTIAADLDSQEHRGQAILEELRHLIPYEAAEITAFNPLDGSLQEVAAVGYEDDVKDGLRSQRFIELMHALNLPESGIPIRMRDLPGRLTDNWAVQELLLPAGYSEGMTMALRTPDGRFTGVLNVSTTSKEHPSDVARSAIAQLCSALGNLADPMRSGRWLALLLGAGSTAVGLDRAGGIVDLPGISSHPLLSTDSDLVRTAIGLAAMPTWSTFMWPDADDFYRVRVVPCAGEQHISTVVSLDAIDIGPLSRRELEVLTLAAEGLSNGEIGDALVISARTVGTHVEHVLEKLGAPNRAAAVALAIREGLILGRVERHDVSDDPYRSLRGR